MAGLPGCFHFLAAPYLSGGGYHLYQQDKGGKFDQQGRDGCILLSPGCARKSQKAGDKCEHLIDNIEDA